MINLVCIVSDLLWHCALKRLRTYQWIQTPTYLCQMHGKSLIRIS